MILGSHSISMMLLATWHVQHFDPVVTYNNGIYLWSCPQMVQEGAISVIWYGNIVTQSKCDDVSQSSV